MGDVIALREAPRALGPVRLLGDRQLARLAARRDQRAFAAIFERYHQPLYRYCRSILLDEEDARDALQSTMARVLQALPGEKREVALKPWLYRIAHNESVEMLRQRCAHAELDESMESAAPGVEHVAEVRERLRELTADLRELPERQRGALVMRELSGLSYEEIGEAFDTTPAVAKQTVYEARLALQEHSEGREMDCDAVRCSLSESDGRVLRGRRIRAHLRSCAGCRGFQAALGERRSDLRALAPPLPAVAVAGLLQGLTGGASAGGAAGLLGLAGGSAGKAVATSAILKSTVAALATATVGMGAADVSGVVDVRLPGPGSGSQSPAATAAPGEQQPSSPWGHPAAGSVIHQAPAGGGASAQAGSGEGQRHAGGEHGRGPSADGSAAPAYSAGATSAAITDSAQAASADPPGAAEAGAGGAPPDNAGANHSAAGGPHAEHPAPPANPPASQANPGGPPHPPAPPPASHGHPSAASGPPPAGPGGGPPSTPPGKPSSAPPSAGAPPAGSPGNSGSHSP